MHVELAAGIVKSSGVMTPPVIPMPRAGTAPSSDRIDDQRQDRDRHFAPYDALRGLFNAVIGDDVGRAIDTTRPIASRVSAALDVVGDIVTAPKTAGGVLIGKVVTKTIDHVVGEEIRSAVLRKTHGGELAHAEISTVRSSIPIEITRKIDKALRSSDPAHQLEGRVARMVRDRITGFKRELGPGATIGEIDIETNRAIIEVTRSPGGKLRQANKFIGNTTRNPEEKAFIVYAERYSSQAEAHISKRGGYVVRSEGELMDLLGQLDRRAHA